ncbi:MAG TPA: Hsp20/alpha crystallin family protein [Anaerolineae bacterium]
MAEVAAKMPIRVSNADRRAGTHGASHPVGQLRTEIDRLLGDFLRGYWHVPFRRSAVDVEPIWRGDIGLGATPAVDIVDKDDAYKLTAELPGVDEKQVEIRFARGTLTVKGKKDEELDDADQDHFVSERRYGDFHRSFRVPDGVDPDKIEASFKNGVLSVTLPKTAESRRKQKKVEIKRA